MATVQDLRNVGYAVGEAFQPQQGATVVSVSGFGVKTYVREDDQATMAALVAAAQAQQS